jgi:glycosyltransferase involved in cell wall biosynthesis
MVSLAIESALNQTYRDIEVVVVDNASTDGIENVIAQYDDPRLRFVKNKENLGLFGNFNRCIEVSRGEFLHILHSDDYIESDFTGICIRFFDEHPNVMMTFTSVICHNGDDERATFFSPNDKIFFSPDGFNQILNCGNFIPCPSVMMRKSVYSCIGNYSLEYPYAGDLNQWLKISRVFDIAYVKEAIIHYCEGEHSETHRLYYTNPIGFIEILKIYLDNISNGESDTLSTNGHYNNALKNFIRKCLIAGIMWDETQTRFHPGILSGLALSSWSMIKARNVIEQTHHLFLLFVIFNGWLVFQIPFFRKTTRKLIIENRKRLW